MQLIDKPYYWVPRVSKTESTNQYSCLNVLYLKTVLILHIQNITEMKKIPESHIQTFEEISINNYFSQEMKFAAKSFH